MLWYAFPWVYILVYIDIYTSPPVWMVYLCYSSCRWCMHEVGLGEAGSSYDRMLWWPTTCHQFRTWLRVHQFRTLSLLPYTCTHTFYRTSCHLDKLKFHKKIFHLLTLSRDQTRSESSQVLTCHGLRMIKRCARSRSALQIPRVTPQFLLGFPLGPFFAEQVELRWTAGGQKWLPPPTK